MSHQENKRTTECKPALLYKKTSLNGSYFVKTLSVKITVPEIRDFNLAKNLRQLLSRPYQPTWSPIQ